MKKEIVSNCAIDGILHFAFKESSCGEGKAVHRLVFHLQKHKVATFTIAAKAKYELN